MSSDRNWLIMVGGGFLVVIIGGVVLSELCSSKSPNPPPPPIEPTATMAIDAPAPPPVEPTPAKPALTGQDRAEQALRGRVHLRSLTKAMHDRGIDETFDVGETDEDVVWRGGVCTESTLKDLARRFSSSFHGEFGFKRMWCLGMSASLE